MDIILKPDRHTSNWILEHTIEFSSEFYQRNEQLISELDTYINVTRVSYNMWRWSKKEDAEKFLTYFILKYSL